MYGVNMGEREREEMEWVERKRKRARDIHRDKFDSYSEKEKEYEGKGEREWKSKDQEDQEKVRKNLKQGEREMTVCEREGEAGCELVGEREYISRGEGELEGDGRVKLKHGV